MAVATRLKSVARNRNAVIFAASTLSGIGGAIAGYKYAERKLAEKYAEISDAEIRAARDHYTKVFKDGEWADPSVLAEKYEEAVDELAELAEHEAKAEAEIRLAAAIIEENEYEHVPYNRPDDIPEKVVINNIFTEHASVAEADDDDDDERYDVEAESAKRRAGRPYIVEYDDYEHNEENKTKSTLTWFEEDGVMVDDNDRALSPSEFQATVGGQENLRFGYASGDPNVVFVHNDKLDAALEITRDLGSYRNLMLGINDHLEHSDRSGNGPRKMRREY